jgi:hypothetical protein
MIAVRIAVKERIVYFPSGTPCIRPWRLRAKHPCFARPGQQANDPLELRRTLRPAIMGSVFVACNARHRRPGRLKRTTRSCIQAKEGADE